MGAVAVPTVDAGEPAGVAVGQDVDGLARLLAHGGSRDQLGAVGADGAVGRDVGVGELGGALVGGGGTGRPRQVADGGAHLVERPAQVDGGGALPGQMGDGAVEALVGGVRAQRQAHAIGGRDADQRRAAHLHGEDGPGGVIERLERDDDELVRQPRLVDDVDRPAVVREPDRAIGFAVDVHELPRAALTPLPARGRGRR